MSKKTIVLVLLAFCISQGFLFAQLPSFPGAEGFGATATGGRGGTVYHVVNLNDSGPGSFRDAVNQPNRTVVFDMGGVIHLKSRVQVASKVTIAGQTAPGDGITLYGNGVTFSGSNNIIARYIRFHGSIDMSKGSCVVVIDSAAHVILDHCSIQWGRWDDLHIKKSENITLQYCIIGEAIDPQRFGALLENPVNLTIHHCLWINNQSRNPKAKANIQFINNVIYNWGKSGFVGGHSATDHYQDMINNYFIAGPGADSSFLSMFTATDHVFHRGNYADLNKDGTLNGTLITNDDFLKDKASLESVPHNIAPIPVTEDLASNAYEKVQTKAGASLVRDSTDVRLISHLASLGKKGKIIRSEAEVGGQGELRSGKIAKDTDQDGMPDSWENEHNLDPKKPEDHKTFGKNGYTNLENYLNYIINDR